jgi:hypothetical protein
MASKQRYYSDDDLEAGITPSQLKRLGRERQKEYMRHWFFRNFEDPVHETPYISAEGGYQFIWGGPYDAAEEIWQEFGQLLPEDRVEEFIKEIEDEGIDEWVPGPDHPDTKQREEEWYREQEEEDTPQQTEGLEQIVKRLQSGVKPVYGDGHDLEQRRAIQGELEELKTALEPIKAAYGGIGHNRPPPDADSPQAVVVIEILDAEETISRELAKPEPDALEVVSATSRLQAAFGWLGKKLDKAADGFATAIGGAVALAAIATLTKMFSPLIHLLAEVIQHVTQWLSYVTMIGPHRVVQVEC